MAQILQMIQGQNRCPLVIENNVGDVLQFLVACDRNSGKHRRFLHRRIDRDDALDAALREQLRISAQQCLIVAMDHGQEEVVALLAGYCSMPLMIGEL